MTYTNYHIRRDRQHVTVLVDDVTTLPVLFGTIYLLNQLFKSRFSTQRNDLISLRFFYSFWLKTHGETFDHFFYRSSFDIASCIPELDNLFHYLLSKQHLTKENEPPTDSTVSNTVSQVNKSTCCTHIKNVARFLNYLNQRYMCVKYQSMSLAEANTNYSSNDLRLKSKVKEFNRLGPAKHTPATRYKSITYQQHLELNDMLLPSSPAVVDPDTGEMFEKVINPINPFQTECLQYRNFIIHRLMFQYGLRVGEVLLLTVDSFGVSQPDSHGNVEYLLMVQNIPDGIDDPRRKPLTLKTPSSCRTIKLEVNDFHYLEIYKEQYRNPYSKNLNHDFMFTASRGTCQPLGYAAIRKVYRCIDTAYIKTHPSFRNNNPFTDMVELTPHVGRHTWAYFTLEYIYKELLDEQLQLSRDFGLDGRIKGLLDAAAEQLRLLGGWEIGSRMPYKYARRFVEKLANDSNIRRIQQEKDIAGINVVAPFPIPLLDNGDFDEFS
ncbi:hypothetical protein [Aeromonas dhakensis]